MPAGAHLKFWPLSMEHSESSKLQARLWILFGLVEIT